MNCYVFTVLSEMSMYCTQNAALHPSYQPQLWYMALARQHAVPLSHKLTVLIIKAATSICPEWPGALKWLFSPAIDAMQLEQ